MNFLADQKKNYLFSVRGMLVFSHLFFLIFFSAFFLYIIFSTDQELRGIGFTRTLSLGFLSVGVLFVLSVVFQLSRINKSFLVVHNQIQKIAEGEIPSEEVDTCDEFGKLIQFNNQVIKNLHNIKLFSSEVGRGNFEFNSTVFNSNTEIGESLQEMKNSLKRVADADRKRNWSSSGLAQLGEILRNHSGSADTYYQSIVSFIVKYTNANQAGLFITETGDDSKVYLDLVACYAYERKKFITKRIEPGDGLVGQAFQEGDIIYLTDIPDNYLSITSGLGNANPRNILIVPLKVNEEINGVLELASFNFFENFQIEFIGKVAENIAVAVSAVKVNLKTGKLLAQSQMMTEELRAQEEELRQNMEEMQSTQDEMLRIQEEMETQNKIFNALAIVSKTDLRGNITYVNDQFLRWSKYSREELIGKNHRILKSGHQDDQIFADLWKTISKGKVFRGEIKNRAKDGTYYWVDTVIAPVLDSNGKPKEYMACRFVINDQKQKEEELNRLLQECMEKEEELRQNMEEMESTQDELRRISAEMEGQLKCINSTVSTVEFDLSGDIITANNNFLEMTGYSLSEISGKNHRLFVTAEENESDEYKLFWNKLRSGEGVKGEFCRVIKNGSNIWIRGIYNPVTDSENRIIKIVKLAYDITEQKSLELELKNQVNQVLAQEEELRQNLEEMKSIQDEMQKVQDEMQAQNQIINSVAIVSKTDVRGNITYVNDEFVKWSGYKPEEIIGKNHRILKSGHQDDKIFKELWKTISSGKIFRGEIKNRAKDGSYYWVDAIIAPVPGPEGKPVEYIAQRFVINDKKEREAYTEELLLNLKNQESELNAQISEALEAKNELAAVAAEMVADLKIINSAFAAIELDMKGKIVKANGKFLELLGYSSEEILGRHDESLVTPEDRSSVKYKKCWIQLAEGHVAEGIFERLTRSGDKIRLRSIYNPVFDEQNKPVKVLKLSYAVNGVASA